MAAHPIETGVAVRLCDGEEEQRDRPTKEHTVPGFAHSSARKPKCQHTCTHARMRRQLSKGEEGEKEEEGERQRESGEARNNPLTYLLAVGRVLEEEEREESELQLERKRVKQEKDGGRSWKETGRGEEQQENEGVRGFGRPCLPSIFTGPAMTWIKNKMMMMEVLINKSTLEMK
jgi:hypothetical protein